MAGVTGGSADWLGDCVSHEAQELRVPAMSTDMLGQYMEVVPLVG